MLKTIDNINCRYKSSDEINMKGIRNIADALGIAHDYLKMRVDLIDSELGKTTACA